MNNMRKANILTISSLLLLEILAFVAFGLSGSIVAYGILGALITILIFVGAKSEVAKYGVSGLGYFVLPLLFFGLLIVISPFTFGQLEGQNKGLIELFIFISFLTFSLVGYYSTFVEKFNISTALMVIYGALAGIVVITYLFTMIQYTPFYTLIYKNYFIYYDGSKASESIGNTAYFLMGFKFQEVSVSYFLLFPALLSSSVLALFFISFKEDKKKFLIYLAYALIGLIPLITMPTLFSILAIVVIAISDLIIVFFAKNHIKTRVFSIAFNVFLGLAVLGFTLVLLNTQAQWTWTAGLRNVIAGNRILNKLLNTNQFISRYNKILQYTFAEGTYLGFFPKSEYQTTLFLNSSSCAFVDTIMTSGYIGLILIIIALTNGVKNVVKYFRSGDDSIQDRAMLIGFVLTFIIYSFINYDMTPYIFYYNFIPFYMNGVFLVVLFLIGYTYKINKKVKVEASEDEK